jgi:hypothetical protein
MESAGGELGEKMLGIAGSAREAFEANERNAASAPTNLNRAVRSSFKTKLPDSLSGFG